MDQCFSMVGIGCSERNNPKGTDENPVNGGETRGQLVESGAQHRRKTNSEKNQIG